MLISRGVHVNGLLIHVRSPALWTCTDVTALSPTPTQGPNLLSRHVATDTKETSNA